MFAVAKLAGQYLRTMLVVRVPKAKPRGSVTLSANLIFMVLC
jgi:hypothetical protein